MQTRKTWEVFAPGKSTGAGACCRSGFLIGPIGLLAQWGERVGRKIKWKGEKSPESLQINLDRKQVSGLNWMYCGPFGMILTDSLFLVTSEEKEKEGVSGECSSTSPEPNSRRWGREFFFPSSGDWLELCGIRGTFQMCLCFSAFLPVPHCSIHFCKFHLTFKYF